MCMRNGSTTIQISTAPVRVISIPPVAENGLQLMPGP